MSKVLQAQTQRIGGVHKWAVKVYHTVWPECQYLLGEEGNKFIEGKTK